MTIAFQELEGSPTIAVSLERTRAVRVFRVSWDDWPAFARMLVGNYEIDGCTFTFVPPIAFPGLPGVVATEIDVAPLDAENADGGDISSIASGTNRYPDAGAKVTVTYETLPEHGEADLPGVPEGTYLSLQADLGGEQVSTPGRLWRWDEEDGESLAPDRRPAIYVPTGAQRVAWHRVAIPPWDAIRAARGKVNGSNFLGAGAETLLFDGARATRQFQFLEGSYWRVEYHFLERTVPLEGGGVGGWNHHYSESGGEWKRIVDEAGNTPYRSDDFAALFAFGPCS